jgi:tetratricopeptide (TPR) repeat protein
MAVNGVITAAGGAATRSGSCSSSALVAGALYVNQVVVPATPPSVRAHPNPDACARIVRDRGRKLLCRRQVPASHILLSEAIQADPQNPSNHIALARLLIYNGEYEEATTSAENALLLNANNSMAHAVRGWGYAFQGNYLQAEAAINRALEIDPNNAIAYAYMAETQALKEQAGQGDLTTQDKAIAASRRAIELGPNLFETRRARGLVLEITGNTEDAVAEFEAAVKMNPTSPTCTSRWDATTVPCRSTIRPSKNSPGQPG